jgi:adenylosuccinate lyase
VQKNAHAAWNTEGGNFKGNLLADTEVMALLSTEDITNCFDPAPLLSNIDAIFARFPNA